MNELYKKEDAYTEEKESTAKDNNSACSTTHEHNSIIYLFVKHSYQEQDYNMEHFVCRNEIHLKLAQLISDKRDGMFKLLIIR